MSETEITFLDTKVYKGAKFNNKFIFVPRVNREPFMNCKVFWKNQLFQYKIVLIKVNSIWAQAVKLHKNFDHLKFLRGEYSLFFKPEVHVRETIYNWIE